MQKTEESVDAGIQLCNYYENSSADSMLIYAIETLELTEKLNLLPQKALVYRKLADAEYYLGNYKKSNDYLKKSVQLAKENNLDLFFIATSVNDIGCNLYILGKFEEAIEYHSQALQIFAENGNLKNKADAINNIAIAHFKLANYDTAINYYLQAFQIDTLLKDTVGMGTTLNNLGRVFIELGKFQTGIEYYLKSIHIAQKTNDKYLQAVRINNLGMAYHLKGDYAEALIYFQKALRIDKELKNERAFANRYNNLALNYQLTKQFKKSEENFLYAIEFYKKYNDSLKLGLVFANYGNLLIEMRNHEKAFDYLLNSYKISVAYKSLSIKRKAVEGLYKIEKTRRNFSEANKWLEELSATKDSLFKIEVSKHVEELEKIYQTNQKEAQIRKLKEEEEIRNIQLEHRKSQRNLAIIIALIAILGIALLIVLQRKLAAKNTQLELLNKTLNKIFGIISHDLKSSIASYQSSGKLLSHFLMQGQNDKIQLVANEISKNSANLANMLNNLLNWSLLYLKNSETQKTEVKIYNILKDNLVLFEQEIAAKNIEIINEIDEDISLFAEEQSLHIVFRNLISNAIKFTSNGKISLKSAAKDNEIVISIEDTGFGMDELSQKNIFEFHKNKSSKGTLGERGTGLGLPLVKEFVEKNDGFIKVISELGKGTTFLITFPYKNE